MSATDGNFEAPLVPTEEILATMQSDGSFTQIDLSLASGLIARYLTPLDRTSAWRQVARLWAEQLRNELGGEYQVTPGDHVLILAGQQDGLAPGLMQFASIARARIHGMLGELAWGAFDGCLIILVLSDTDDYYDYISQYYPEGNFAASAGVQIRKGHPHIALPLQPEWNVIQRLAHELSHACVAHLPLPLWVDEGVALGVEKALGGAPVSSNSGNAEAVWAAQSGWSPPVMWRELAQRHHAFWNEENIQDFWAGVSFHEPGDASELSYSLAEVLVHLIATDQRRLCDYLSRAHFNDAGQTAAFEVLGRCLGEFVGGFLGDGDWRPVRKSLVERWAKAGWNDAGEGERAGKRLIRAGGRTHEWRQVLKTWPTSGRPPRV